MKALLVSGEYYNSRTSVGRETISRPTTLFITLRLQRDNRKVDLCSRYVVEVIRVDVE